MRYAQAQSVANPAAERTNLGQNTGGANREHGIDRRVALCCVNDQCQHTFPQNTLASFLKIPTILRNSRAPEELPQNFRLSLSASRL